MLAYLKMHGCAVDASLTIKRLPTSAALVDRSRIEETRSAASLDPCITLASCSWTSYSNVSSTLGRQMQP